MHVEAFEVALDKLGGVELPPTNCPGRSKQPISRARSGDNMNAAVHVAASSKNLCSAQSRVDEAHQALRF